MRRRAVSLLALLLLAAPCLADDAATTPPGVTGTVAAASDHLASASVYAYEVADLTVREALTNEAGRFLFERLPAGVYKLIAYKAGFEPAVVMLSRAASDARQFVELRLEEETADAREGEDYWSVRERIPPDVLRDIQTRRIAALTAPSGASLQAVDAIRGSVEATTGYDDLAGAGDAYLSGAGIDMRTAVGAVELGVTGEYRRLEQLDATPVVETSAAGARATSLGVELDGAAKGSLDLTTLSQSLASQRRSGLRDTDFERYRLSWTQPLGERSRSRFSAQYTEESNFYRRSTLAPAVVPDASRQLSVQGTYEMQVTDRTSIEAGMRYRQRRGTSRQATGTIRPSSESIELFGKSGWRARPAVLVEYGLYTQLEDGSYSLAPQGSVVLQLSENWQATTTGTVRIDQKREPGDRAESPQALQPIRSATADGDCRGLQRHCVRVVLAYTDDGEESVTVTAVHREIAEALHYYFGDDLLEQESLYLTTGDELPEVRLVASRRISPQILARLETAAAEGGGGVFYARDAGAYENRVRYFVTALDTRFQRSSTGVFLAFHHLEQALQDIRRGASEGAPDMELERLQLMLSQDLDLLATLAADWALHLNLELSRGALPFSLVDESFEDIRRQISGGVSIRF